MTSYVIEGLSLFGHVACIDPGVPAQWCSASDGGYLWKQKANGQVEKTAGSPSQRLAQRGSGGCQRSTALHAVEIWDRQGSWSGTTVHSDYATTMMMMTKDISLASKMEGKTNFSRHLQAVWNCDCWVFENHWRMVESETNWCTGWPKMHLFHFRP